MITQSILPAASTDTVTSDVSSFWASRQPHQLSSTIDGDHEDAGIWTKGEPSGSSQYVGVYANHVVYKSGTLSLSLPPNATHSQTLFAPTTRPPNGGCLEVGTAYTTEVGSKVTSAALYVFDFCSASQPNWGISPIPPSGSPQFPIDDAFLNTYTFQSKLGIREYTVIIYTEDKTISSTSLWFAKLRNYATGSWDELYRSTGQRIADPRGWSIFETWYQKGLCDESIPTLGADSIRYLNSTTNNWDDLQASMGSLTNTVDIGGSLNQNCFVDDSTGKASYAISPTSVANHWQVVSR